VNEIACRMIATVEPRMSTAVPGQPVRALAPPATAGSAFSSSAG
jgi:hypothetical protein